MILISHRGNINGIEKDRENHPEYVKNALNLGYEVETDIWLVNNKWFLGHDKPSFEIAEIFFDSLDNSKVWFHAKNWQALSWLKEKKLHYFWHQDDSFTLTSKGFIWVHCNTKELPAGSICVLPEIRTSNENLNLCAGICSDFIEKYK